ncbi:type II toxin-antitoxin system RelE family toxin [Demequina iriomotensis]|uniref:type II toxin-antitoxin system RelE family toxin n=1 Tax=Demequina iriomotensis TaxID=1536641 RepID=UPI0007829CCC|nr:type II toxin-antitoxin system RelE/ParE family toxin [Demequina iriomotensis]
MTYRVEVRPAAARSLRRIHPQDQARLRGAIELLARDPRPPASRRLVGSDSYRVRVGDHRIIYAIDEGVLVVLVLAIGHRPEVYRR